MGDEVNKPQSKSWLRLDALKAWLPIAYLLLVFWGLLHETIYYRHFDINIVNYIDLSEVLLVLYDDFLLAVLCAFGGVIVSTGLVKIPLDIIQMIVSIRKKRSVDFQKYVLYGIVPLSFIFLILMESEDVSKLNTFSAVFGAISYGSFDQKFSEELKRVILGTALVFMTILIAINAQHNAEQALKQDSKISLTYKDSLTISTQPRLVGETRNYLFLYTDADSTTTVIRRDQVSYMQVTRSE